MNSFLNQMIFTQRPFSSDVTFSVGNSNVVFQVSSRVKRERLTRRYQQEKMKLRKDVRFNNLLASCRRQLTLALNHLVAKVTQYRRRVVNELKLYC